MADTLSNVHLRETDDTHDAFDGQVRLVVANLLVFDQKMSHLQASIPSDSDMQRFIAVSKEGSQTDDRRRCPQFVKPLWNYSDELWLMEGLVFKGERIVIPSSLRKDMLKRIHR